MNQKPSQSRLPASCRHAKGVACADLAGTCLLLLTVSTIETSPATAWARERREPIRVPPLEPGSAVKPPGRTLGERNGALHVLPAGDVVGKHVDHEEVGDRGGG